MGARFTLSTELGSWREGTTLVCGPAELGGDLLAVLIKAEHSGSNTVFLATSLDDLDSAVAKVSRYVVVDDDVTEEEAKSRFGPERVLRARSAAPADVPEWIGRLPRPKSQTLVRKIWAVVGRWRIVRRVRATIGKILLSASLLNFSLLNASFLDARK